MPNFMAMTNEEVLRNYPQHASKATSRKCSTWTGYTNSRKPCKSPATLRVREKNYCASHAKSLLNAIVNYG